MSSEGRLRRLANGRILYKTRLPFILVFNKIDVEPHDFAIEWMQDFEAYQAALSERGRDEHGEMAYSSSLMSSMCLVLEEFYKNLKVNCDCKVHDPRLTVRPSASAQ